MKTDDETVRALIEALEECAGLIEQNYRQALGMWSKRDKDRAVAQHKSIAMARAALKRAK